MVLFKNRLKCCLKVLIVLLLFAISTNIELAWAAENTSSGTMVTDINYTLDKTNIDTTSLETFSEETENNQITSEKELNFTNKLMDYYLQNEKRNGPEWLKYTDLQVYFTDHHTPTYSIETLKPMGKRNAYYEQWFWQGRYAYAGSAGRTANLGLGWRMLSEDKQSILGCNIFYDYGFQYNLSRIGIGGEYFNKLAEYRMNWYQPISDNRLISVEYQKNGILRSYIRAVEGLDFETGTSFYHLPWLKVFGGAYYWDNKHNADEFGYRLRTKMKLNNRLNMEIGYLNSNTNHALYGKLNYQLSLGSKSIHNDLKKEAAVELSDKLLQKVERFNELQTETYSQFEQSTGALLSNTAEGSVTINLTGKISNDNYTVTLVGGGTTVRRYTYTLNSSTPAVTISNMHVGTYAVDITSPSPYEVTPSNSLITVETGKMVQVDFVSSIPSYPITFTNPMVCNAVFIRVLQGDVHYGRDLFAIRPGESVKLYFDALTYYDIYVGASTTVNIQLTGTGYQIYKKLGSTWYMPFTG